MVTDPPFFDNVHYSELADFFHVWQQLYFGNGGRKRLLQRDMRKKSRTPMPRPSPEKLGRVFS